jgi:hypothetical protein
MDAAVSAPNFSLVAFERLVVERAHEGAALMALQILESIDTVYGCIQHIDLGAPYDSADDEQRAVIFCTRFAAALTRVLTEGDFGFSDVGFEAFLLQHRWIDLIFSISGFGTSDHLLPMIGRGVGRDLWNLSSQNIIRILPILSMNSQFDLDFDQWWRANPVATATAFLHFLGSRSVFQPRAFALRERLLEWLPARLDDIKLGTISLSKASECYMHCSYAFTPRKHAIKAAIINQMRRQCIEIGCREVSEVPAGSGVRPTIVVIAEHFSSNHSIYRTHSQAVRSLRARFRVVGVLPSQDMDPATASCFDEQLPYPATDFATGVKSLATDILTRAPSVVLHLGVGMRAESIALASLRLAPVQCVSFGHTATTMSPVIDYMILPEDFVGSPDCFSEKLATCPKEAMPFVPVIRRAGGRSHRREDESLVRVAVPASIMKLNPRFLDTLARIAQGSRRPTEFHFFPLAAFGLVHVELARVVRRRLSCAIVHPQLPLEIYVEKLSTCDLFLSPFPYGNMNSIIDAVSVAVPGVCLDGIETHAHIDAAMFARIGLPPELAANSIDGYVAAACRLIDDADWRRDCAKICVACDLDAAFFRGNPNLFCQRIADLVGHPVRHKPARSELQ